MRINLTLLPSGRSGLEVSQWLRIDRGPEGRTQLHGSCRPRSGLYVVFSALVAALLECASFPTLAGSAQFVYDSGDRLIQVIDSSGNSAAYSYDASGNLLSITPLSPTTAAVVGFSSTSADVGNTITIYGSGFSTTPANNTVSFNGVAATVLSATANALTVQVPSGASTGLVTVSDSNGTAVSTTNFVVVGSAAAPTISSFTPQLVDPGAAITISGTQFSPTVAGNQVSVAGQAAIVTSAGSSSLAFTVPSAASSGHITVTTNGGTVVSAQDLFVAPAGWGAARVASTARIAVNGSTATLSATPLAAGMAIFDGTAGQVVSIDDSATTSGCFPGFFALYQPSPVNQELEHRSSCSGPWNVTLPTTGTYTVLAVDMSSTDPGSVTLGVSTIPVSNSGTIQIGGSAVTVTTAVAHQESRLTFASTQPDQLVTISAAGVTYSSGCSQQVLKVLGPAPGNPVVHTGDLCSTQSAVLGAVGTYTLEVIPYGTDTGSVSLSLATVAPVTGSIAIGGAPVTVTTSTPGQQAVLTFTTTAANQDVTIQASSDTFASGCGYQKAIITGPAPSTTVLYTNDLCTTHAVLLSAAGTYSLSVIPYYSDVGSVAIQLASAPMVSSAITIGGSPVTLSTTLAGQQAQFTFTTTTRNQVVSIQPSGCTLSDCWDAMLLVSGPAPGNTYIDTIYDATIAAWLETFRSPGTYTITLIPYDTDIGSLTLKLQNAPPVVGAVSIDGSPVTLTTTVPGQLAQWSFTTTTSNQRISLQRSGATYPDGCSAGQVAAIDPGRPGNSLTWLDVCPGSFAQAYTFSTPGSYLMEFEPNPYYLDVGSVTIKLQNAPDVTASLSINGSPVTVTTTVPAQQAYVSFASTSPNQAIRLLVSGSSYSLPCSTTYQERIDVSGPTQWEGSTNFCAGTTSITLEGVGTYQMHLTPYSMDTGSITLQVLSP